MKTMSTLTADPTVKKSNRILFIILLIALILRVWGLNFQSLWLDELHTMNEANPDITWKELFFYLRCCDQHPPLHFFLSRALFTIFGHTPMVARVPSVIAGTLSIWAIFYLGKELFNRNLGLIAAALTAVNYFHLSYSQEARNYIFAFLFAVLSFLYFVRLLKNMGAKNSILYAVCTLLLLYTHYYSLFVVISQIVLIVIFFFLEARSNKLNFAKWFLLSGLIIGLGYLPWVPFLLEMSTIKSFWISPVSPKFLIEFYNEYFGWVSKLMWLSLLLFLVFMLRAFYQNKVTLTAIKERPLPFVSIILSALALVITFQLDLTLPYSLIILSLLFLLTIYALVGSTAGKTLAASWKDRPLPLILTVLSIWVIFTYLVPYIRSVMVVPMLFPRYAIVVLPAFLIALALGIELINQRVIRFVILAAFIIFSMIGILSDAKYYSEKRKTQYREMTKYVIDNNQQNYPIINQVTSWHQQYYFKFFHVKPLTLPGTKVAAVDSILRKATPRHTVKGFWIVGAHGDAPLTEEQKKGLDTAYTMVMEKFFRDSWAQLYVAGRQDSSSLIKIAYTNFEGGTLLADDATVALWGGTIKSKPVNIPTGKYQLFVDAKGTGAKGEMAKLVLAANGKKIAEFSPTFQLETNSFNFEVLADEAIVFSFELINDYSSSSEDRNAFIHSILLRRVQ